MHHYTREEKLKAIQLYIQYDKSPSAVIYELGYPSKNRLYKWYQEYIENSNDFPADVVYSVQPNPFARIHCTTFTT